MLNAHEIWLGFTSSDSTNSGSKILGKKSPEWSKTQNLNLPHAGNYLHNFDMVLGIISNLERKVYRRMHIGYVQILHHLI